MYTKMKPEERLKLLENLIAQSDIGFIVISQEHKIIEANRRFAEMLGYNSQEEVIGLYTWEYEHIMSKEQIMQNFKDLSSIAQRFESVHRRKDGSTFPVEVIMGGGSVYGENGVYKAVMCICQDITERQEREETLRYMSIHDSLTGVHNRAYFEELLEKYQKTGIYPVSFLLCDVNDLKFINDQFGHADGDEVLRAAAILIESALRKGDAVARYGGDEFVVILPDADEENARKIVGRIEERIQNHNKKTRPYALSLAIGVATSHDRNQLLSQVFQRADQAMYEAKQSKKSFS